VNWSTGPTSAPAPVDREPKLAAEGFIDSYMTWRDACEDLHAAYGRWHDSKPRQSGLAFEAYRAALDREEQAARVHASWAKRVLASAG
jgi:hypothetical protein